MPLPRAQRWPLTCLLALAAWWGVLAIDPRHRDSWLHENLLVFVAVPFTVWVHLRVGLSRTACTLITLFFALHLVGAHYTYSEVPLLERPDGRNHYDRVVHFSYGLLLAAPLRELAVRVSRVRGFWSYFWPACFVMATSMLYEIVEWLFVLVVDPRAGTAFLGTQGDEWDAQKDMALASGGAVLALAATALARRALQAERGRAQRL